ncbi:MAG: hypothetical protein WBB05_10355 [Mycolicibacterium fortuitum]|uniref:hypothetical protein n=1 Tax=Mycolicibacterium fortuitum TaxID=1766 RepID=UPI001CDC0B1A|nr:hypothetical protein [Mycolicibacterium fortuitum]UBV13630.1 hypothetical protein H8Z57_22800 [Mycolicibacterium fortuitum]
MNDSTADRIQSSRRTGPQGGPPLAPVAAVSLVLLLVGLGVGVALGGVMPLPYGAASEVLGYVHDHRAAVQASAVGTFAASVPLAIYAATASTRLRQLGVTAPGATIALAGGILASGALGLAGLICWTMSRPEVVVADGLIRALYYLVFLTGGVGHIVALGLLLAGIAVPSLILGLLPRPLAWTGLAIAALAEVATLVLIWPEAAVILPVARFTGFIWLIVAGALLPRRRSEVRRA